MNEVKLLALTDTTARVGGYGVIFGGQDLEGDTFTPDTDFDAELVPTKRVYYDHTLRDIKSHLGAVSDMKVDETGIWIEAELDRNRSYVDQVLTLIERGALGWSSGSVSHLVRREGKTIKAWPLVEFSLTPTPAEPRTLGVRQLKQLAEETPALAGLVPEESGDDSAIPTAGGDAAVYISQPIITFPTEVTMTEEIKGFDPSRIDAIEAKMGAFSEALNTFMQRIENSAPLKQAGYIAPDSETDHANVKSLGDWLIAVGRGNVKRLAHVYGSIKDLTEGEGPRGGYLVPEEYRNNLLRVDPQSTPILSRVRRVPVATDSGKYPALDVFTAPTAGSGATAAAGGLTVSTVAEGGTFGGTQPKFEEIHYTINKIGDTVTATNELIADSPQSIEALLTDLIRIAVNSKLERNILRGNGSGEMLGILNSAVTVAVTTATDNVFAKADAMSMLARFQTVSPGASPVWIMHRSVIPDLSAFNDEVSALVNWNNGIGSLLGYPIVYSEHMPQANGDDVLLADLGAYLLFERQGLTIGYSEHAAFTSDKGTWRFTYRCDGKPWLRSAITLADPTGSYTVSPFVKHDD